MFKKIKKLFPFSDNFIGIRRRQLSEQNELAIAAERSKPLAVFLLLLMWVVSTVIMNLPREIHAEYDFVEKQKSPRYIFAKFDYSYIDEIATNQAKEKAINLQPYYYQISAESSADIRSVLMRFLEVLKLREDAERVNNHLTVIPGVPLSEIVANLSAEDFATLNFFNHSSENLIAFEKEIDTLIGTGILPLEEKNNRKINDSIKIIDLAGRERASKPVNEVLDCKSFAQAVAKNISEKSSIIEVFEKLYKGKSNLYYDHAKTEKNRAEIAAKVPNVMIDVSKNSPIVSKGEIITPEILLSLKTHSEQELMRNAEGKNYTFMIQKAIFSLLLVVFIGFYVYHIHPDVMNSNFKILTLSSVTIISMIINFFAMKLFFEVSQEYRLNQNLIINFIPIALPSAILVTMLGFRVAIYVGFYISSAMAVITGNTFEFAFIGIISSSIAALVIRKAKNHRAFFFRTFLSVSLCNWVLNVNVAQYLSDITMVYKSALIAISCGIMTAILAQTIIYFYEVVFNVTTNMSLLVLCDYTHPLLERLKREAPGTFYHSIMVATLAEDAAIAINANPIKAKCGALFHDIGKLANPEYFTENNIETENKHLHLSPQNSFVLIRNHVKDGLALAKKYKLNQVIKNAIVQHHGNDLSYFYYQAHKLSNSEDIPEEQFRYHGTPPRSKEMVIISLADSCEAAVRSIEKPTMSKIEAMIDEIFKKRFRDNQLINAEVTCGELKKIRDSFVANLVSMSHGRIAYKKEKESNESDLFMESK
ncbi:MAG: HDIG domain-containing protein [Lentisphaeria bacterium]|nr:HDIG domain-containing protein [Lentisphaeria bacterium]